jgi:hypothetical protein
VGRCDDRIRSAVRNGNTAGLGSERGKKLVRGRSGGKRHERYSENTNEEDKGETRYRTIRAIA